MMKDARHLIWIPAAGAAGFFASYVFGDLISLPVDVYYLIYFTLIGAFLVTYTQVTRLNVRRLLKRRAAAAGVAGLLIGALMVRKVVSLPPTMHYEGLFLWWAVLWRGLIYGAVDGLLLFSLPWIVTWRALRVRRAGIGRKIGASLLAWAFILFVTTTYHLGYRDFRSAKIIQPNVGSTITSVATLATANPAASLVAHVCLHIGAVLHSPRTELFLPPHSNGKRIILRNSQCLLFSLLIEDVHQLPWPGKERRVSRIQVSYFTSRPPVHFLLEIGCQRPVPLTDDTDTPDRSAG